MSFKKSVELILNRPFEPSFVAKGNGELKKSFEIPESFYTDRYKLLSKLKSRVIEDGNETNEKKKTNKVLIREINLPNLQFVLSALKRNDMFSLYFPMHRRIAARLIHYFKTITSLDKLESTAVFARDYINPFLFNYTITVALLHRHDTNDLVLPTVSELFPDRFFNGDIIREAREELSIVPDGSRISITIDPAATATNKNEEQRIAYFREDLGINLSYYNWNLIYPFEAIEKEIVDKDRRGELWYYLHQQILARYNSERLCNGLFRVKRLNNLRDRIDEGYFPKLTTQNSSHTWPPRFENCYLSDLHRPYDLINLDLSQLERWIDRIIDAIELGFAMTIDGKQVLLNNDAGINHLGNLIQSSALSLNREFYGDLSNMGHAFISYCHDPDNRFLESYGVMGEPATALRDPVFYRWHAFLAGLFQLHKKHLPIYTEKELGFDGIKINEINIEFQNKKDGTVQNQLKTYWQQSDVNLSLGLDFAPKGNVYARLKHLQHQAFNYKIRLENDSGVQKPGTIRLFLAPKSNERGLVLTFPEQRLLMIELDRFVTQIQPGINYIIRRSDESSVTIPFNNTFRPEVNREKTNAKQIEKSLNCLCGWPQHMLIPKGTDYGTVFVLFAMVSNDDQVFVSNKPGELTAEFDQCDNASSYCGRFNKKYPDKRSIGFPFDRPASDDILFLDNFLLLNMRTQDVTIKFTNKDVQREQPVGK